MFRNENCKFRAKTLKADEAVSGYDTARRPEKFAAEICNLQSEDNFSEVP
ncbi:hypothetical protein HZC21_02780 [Candidatus Peregrinibacteria bacterium]|nr:hypothetical protein [Candidatus Peregrinibacteria bacterium]